jgi:DNA-binding NarL/FixJ family response regulator
MQLTDREKSIMQGIVDGKTDKQIADSLKISVYSVNEAVLIIRRALEVKGNRVSLARACGEYLKGDR